MRVNLSRLLIFPREAERRGSVLILVLWLMSILVIFAIYLGAGVRQKLVLVHRLDERSKARYIAEAGVKKAVTILENKTSDKEYPYDTFSDTWRNDEGLFKGVPVGDGSYDISYNYANELTGKAETCYGIVDEESKININRVDQHLLRRFFRTACGMDGTESQELAASIVDWRDKDSELSIPLGSAEDFDYQGLNRPYEAKDSHFELLEELFLVRGMNMEIFERLKPYITVYGSGKVNVNTASGVVLTALGLDGRLPYKILSYRYGEDKKIGTADDGVFVLKANILPKLSQFADLSESEVAKLSRVIDKHLDVASSFFSIKCTAHIGNKRELRKVSAVCNRSGRVVYWREL